MREILFKAKRADNGNWVEGYYIAYAVSGGGKLYHHIKNATDTYPILEETLCQFIGLQDISGNKIFENDKLFITLENGETNEGVVFYKKKVCQFMLNVKDSGRHCVWQITEKRLPIIRGNIYNKL